MMLPRRGDLIWPCTTPSTVAVVMPSLRAWANAASRLGPAEAELLARASAWQLPQAWYWGVGFFFGSWSWPVYRRLPLTRSTSCFSVPQAPRTAGAARARTIEILLRETIERAEQ